MNLILFDNWCRLHLLPLTYTRPAADLRIGITTIREKWERCFHTTASTLTQPYLQTKFPLHTTDDNLLIASALLPNDDLVTAIQQLKPEEALYHQQTLLAFRTAQVENLRHFYENHLQKEHSTLPLLPVEYRGAYNMLQRPYQLFLWNEKELSVDYQVLTESRRSQQLSSTNTLIGDPRALFIEQGAVVEAATFNTTEGPIYIGAGAEIMEGSRLRGPIAVCAHAVIKMDTKIYGATTIGPYCKVGGELANVVMIGYANKAHDGFIGNAVIGEWCNLGADTNCSNLKNNYSSVRLWNYASQQMEETGQQFCGLIMGDHAKCGINSMFNTGTVVGVCANLFGSGFHPKVVPSFAFGSPDKPYQLNQLDKVFATACQVMERRHQFFDKNEQNLLQAVYDLTTHFES